MERWQTESPPSSPRNKEMADNTEVPSDPRTLNASPLGKSATSFRGHEFHYATVLEEVGAPTLFDAGNAAGDAMGATGLVVGRVAGSFIHLIDRMA